MQVGLSNHSSSATLQLIACYYATFTHRNEKEKATNDDDGDEEENERTEEREKRLKNFNEKGSLTFTQIAHGTILKKKYRFACMKLCWLKRNTNAAITLGHVIELNIVYVFISV